MTTIRLGAPEFNLEASGEEGAVFMINDQANKEQFFNCEISCKIAGFLATLKQRRGRNIGEPWGAESTMRRLAHSTPIRRKARP
jgi:hypothetical protein